MKLKHRFSIISVLMALAISCASAALILPACGGSSDDGSGDSGTSGGGTTDSGSGDSGSTSHTHVYSEDWAYDDTYHWLYCTVDGCSETFDTAEHTYDYNNYTTTTDGQFVYTCTECGYQITEASAIYSVTITNIGGKAISGVDVELRNSSGSLVSTGTTSSSGQVRFRNLSSGAYTAYIDVDTIPVGYSLDDDAVTLTNSEKSKTVVLDSAVITNEDMPSGHTYSTGDVIYDFTVTCYETDGSSYTVNLADYLDKYEAVVINFFYTTCGPCKAEVPYMEQAYEDYSDKIGLIAFDYTGYGDTLGLMEYFKFSYGLSFDFTLDTSAYYSNFNVTGFPTTVVIDRYGCIAEIETGTNTSAASWINIFEYYSSSSYTPSYTTSKRDDTSDSQVESDVTMPDSDDIVEAIVNTTDYSLTTSSTFTFNNYSEDGIEDKYNWPWIIGTDEVSGVKNYIMTSNEGIVGGYSIIVIDVSLKAGQAVLFDYYLSTEENYDIFYVQVDTVLQLETSGTSTSWQTCLAYVAVYDGDYQITMYYQKDSSKNVDDDTVYVSNLRVANASETTSSSSYHADILYNAATNYADSSVDVSGYGEGYGYLNYVSVYLASDGYYHVGSKEENADPGDDPYLLADIYYGTPWYSTMSVWFEVYGFGTTEINTTLAGSTKFGDPYDAFEDYAWTQNNCPLGYIPVNEELHDMLVAFVAAYGRTTGDQLENQWLELCRYYVHYGSAHDDDKCYSLENAALTYGIRYALDLGEIESATNTDNGSALTFTAEIPTLLVPRGNYYTFTVDTDGVYRIYSYNVQGDSDAAPYAFLMDANGNTLEISETDDLSYVDGFVRTDAAGAFTLTGSGGTFTPKYSGTYNFTLTSGSGAVISGTDDDGNSETYLESGETTFSLTLEAGTEYVFQLSGATSATLRYEIESYDFAMYVSLKAGETYYLGCSFGSTEETGSYDVGIYYVGEKLVYLATLTTDSYYTYREVTGSDGTTSYEYYVPTRVSNYALNPDDNCWYTLDENGDFDKLIYIDMVGTTLWNYYSSYTIETAIENNVFAYDDEDNPYGWTSAHLALLNQYLANAIANTGTVEVTAGTGSLTGLVPANNTLVTYINYFFNGGGPYTDKDHKYVNTTYAENAWMLAAYYLRIVE